MGDARRVPEPPAASTLDPLTANWVKGLEVFHIHSATVAPNAFNPNTSPGRGRFHPFLARRLPVPTWYGNTTADGAIAEVIFQNAAFDAAPRLVRRQLLQGRVLSRLTPTRDLRLADLTGHGLRRLGLKRSQLLDTDAEQYEATARWGQALYRSRRRPVGIVWVSRQFDRSSSLVLFGDRVAPADLQLLGEPLPLFEGPGYLRVLEAAEVAGLTIAE